MNLNKNLNKNVRNWLKNNFSEKELLRVLPRALRGRRCLKSYEKALGFK